LQRFLIAGMVVLGLSTGLAAADAVPPETTITVKPPKKVFTKKKTAKVTFAFASSEPGTGGFQCQVDFEEYTLCTSPYVRNLKRGAHTFRVRAFDAESTPDPTLAVYGFAIKKKTNKKK
jgi:hypothetical protein